MANAHSSAARRFVLLRHETPPGYARGLHWDFMIEADGALRTWALTESPLEIISGVQGPRKIDAEALPDHRIAYLEYQGEIAGNRGAVTRCEQGTCQILRSSENELLLQLHGQQLVGQALLQSQSSNSVGVPQRWTFSFTPGSSAIGSTETEAPGLGESGLGE